MSKTWPFYSLYQMPGVLNYPLFLIGWSLSAYASTGSSDHSSSVVSFSLLAVLCLLESCLMHSGLRIQQKIQENSCVTFLEFLSLDTFFPVPCPTNCGHLNLFQLQFLLPLPMEVSGHNESPRQKVRTNMRLISLADLH